MYFRLMYFGNMDECLKHAAERTKALQATAGVHSTGTEKEGMSKKEPIFSGL